jgi:hypothetical protein
MARLHHRNFGVSGQLQAYRPRRPFSQILDEATVTLLFCLFLIGAGLVALGWWLSRRLLLLIMGALGSQRSLPSSRQLLDSVRVRFFSYRRDRWCRVQEQVARREGDGRAH